MKSLENEVRKAIAEALKQVNEANYPEIHSRIQSKIGYQAIEAKIIQKMAADHFTPEQAIPHIEQEFNLL